MGEYAKFAGRDIKMGTCEDMYYLRAEQVPQLRPLPNSLNPRDPEVLQVLRFRFPWPDEDGTEPGAFDRYNRTAAVHDVQLPEGVEHDLVQFVAQAGYLVSLPCPEGPPATHGLQVHRNGFAGPVLIVQQGYRNGNLAVICRCGGCGAPFNLPTQADAEPVIVACRAEADRMEKRGESGAWWHTVADRIAAGYAQAIPRDTTRAQPGQGHAPDIDLLNGY